jgi:peptidyl-prolyl cis-trans isomerase A (cyclophilin A)
MSTFFRPSAIALALTLVFAPLTSAHADDGKKDQPAPALTPADSRPADSRPADSKPADSKPVEGQPAGKDQPKPAAPTTTKQDQPAKEQLVYVVLQTSMGDITLELNQAKAPISVENFLKYVDDKHYDGTVFHRVINGFMLQTGGFTADGSQKPTRAPIKNEGGNGLNNDKYTVAMARTNVADSATSQFYINVADNTFLNRASAQDRVGYAVFGKVVAGTDVVEKIKAVRTGTNAKTGMGDWPLQNVTINVARRATADEAAKFQAK